MAPERHSRRLALPNTALHRTPSTAPPSPVSFRALGARKLVRVARPFLLSATLALAGCHSGPSLKQFQATLDAKAGPEATRCGIVMLQLPKAEAVACANTALRERRPFTVAFQVLGFDS